MFAIQAVCNAARAAHALRLDQYYIYFKVMRYKEITNILY
jgi:hypothetical protein